LIILAIGHYYIASEMFVNLFCIAICVVASRLSSVSAQTEYVVVDYFGYDDSTCSGDVKLRTHAIMDTCLYKSLLEDGRGGRSLAKSGRSKNVASREKAFKATAAKVAKVFPFLNHEESSNTVQKRRENPTTVSATTDKKKTKTAEVDLAESGKVMKYKYKLENGDADIRVYQITSYVEDIAQLDCDNSWDDDNTYDDVVDDDDFDGLFLPYNQCFRSDTQSNDEDWGYAKITIVNSISYPTNEGVVVSYFNYDTPGKQKCNDGQLDGIWGSFWFKTGECEHFSQISDDELVDDRDDDARGRTDYGNFYSYTCDAASKKVIVNTYDKANADDPNCQAISPQSSRTYSTSDLAVCGRPLNGEDDDKPSDDYYYYGEDDNKPSDDYYYYGDYYYGGGGVDFFLPEENYDAFGWGRVDCGSGAALSSLAPRSLAPTANPPVKEYAVVDYFGFEDSTCSGPVKMRTHAVMNTCLYDTQPDKGIRKLDPANEESKKSAAHNHFQAKMKNVFPFSSVKDSQADADHPDTLKTNKGEKVDLADFGWTKKYIHTMDNGFVKIDEQNFYSDSMESLACSEDQLRYTRQQLFLPFDTCVQSNRDSNTYENFGYMRIRQFSPSIEYPEFESSPEEGVALSYFNYDTAGREKCNEADLSGVWGSMWFQIGACERYSQYNDDDVVRDDDDDTDDNNHERGDYFSYSCDATTKKLKMSRYSRSDSSCSNDPQYSRYYSVSEMAVCSRPLNGENGYDDDNTVDFFLPEDHYNNYGWGRLDCQSAVVPDMEQRTAKPSSVPVSEYAVIDYYDDDTCTGEAKVRTHALMNTCLYETQPAWYGVRKLDSASEEHVVSSVNLSEEEKKIKEIELAANMNLRSRMGRFFPFHVADTSNHLKKKSVKGENVKLAAINGRLKKFTYVIDNGFVQINENKYNSPDIQALACDENQLRDTSQKVLFPMNQCVRTKDSNENNHGYMIIRPFSPTISYPTTEGVAVSYFNYDNVGKKKCNDGVSSGIWGSFWFKTGECEKFYHTTGQNIDRNDEYATYSCDPAEGEITFAIKDWGDSTCSGDNAYTRVISDRRSSVCKDDNFDRNGQDTVGQLPSNFYNNFGYGRMDCGNPPLLQWRSSIPTAAPSVSFNPSFEPTVEPTFAPSSEPTVEPTFAPSSVSVGTAKKAKGKKGLKKKGAKKLQPGN